MNMGNIKLFVVAGLVGLTAAGAFYLLREPKDVQGEPPPAVKTSPVAGQKWPTIAPAAASSNGHTGRAAQPLERRSPLVSTLASTNEIVIPEDRAEADTMQARLDDDDHAAALALAQKLMRSKDAEVRSRVIATLGWIGIRALPELSAMLADERDDLAAEAFQQWKDAADEVSDDAMKGDLIVAGMENMTRQDNLEDCVMEFNSLPDDIAVRGLVAVIQSLNPVASEVARDHYSFVTSEDYTTPADAEKWIKENVEPPVPAPPAIQTVK